MAQEKGIAMAEEKQKTQTEAEEHEAAESRPLETSELEEVVGGHGPERDPTGGRPPDGWGKPDPNNPWSIP